MFGHCPGVDAWLQVIKCTRSTCYYEILGIARGANDDDIKKACELPQLLAACKISPGVVSQ